MTLTLTDDLNLNLGTKEKVLPQGIDMLNRKTLPRKIKKLWPILKF